MKKRDRLDIVYEDKELLVVNKPTHMLTIQDNKGNTESLYNKVYDYLHKKNQKVFIVHRLDKDTSGIVVFAKNENIKKQLQDNWNDLTITREYYAVVEGIIKEKGTIKQYLTESKTLQTYVTTKEKGKLAITHYKPVSGTKGFTVLKVNIDTGRKNQIRVAMQSINHPIVGDKKYGASKNPLRRVCLHANKLVLKINNKEYIFEAKIPSEFSIFK